MFQCQYMLTVAYDLFSDPDDVIATLLSALGWGSH